MQLIIAKVALHIRYFSAAKRKFGKGPFRAPGYFSNPSNDCPMRSLEVEHSAESIAGVDVSFRGT